MAGGEGKPPEQVRADTFRAARIGTAAAFTFLLVTLLLLDALLETYELQPVTLFALLTTILTLLGIEIRDTLFRR